MASNRTAKLPAPTLTPTPTSKALIITSSSTTLIVPDFSDLGEVVTFIIGPSKKKFLVHKKFACNYSPVRKAAFTGTFIEGQTQTYTMEDTTEEVFTLLVQYNGSTLKSWKVIWAGHPTRATDWLDYGSWQRSC